VAECEETFGGKIAVRELVAEKHADDGGDWEGVQDPGLLARSEPEAGEVPEDQREPGAPDEKLEHHHDEKSQSHRLVLPEDRNFGAVCKKGGIGAEGPNGTSICNFCGVGKIGLGLATEKKSTPASPS
jgi:hypothetical protein